MKTIQSFQEGVAYAKKALAMISVDGYLAPTSFSKPNAARTILLQAKGTRMISEKPDELVRKAESDPDFFDALCFGAAVHLKIGKDLPPIICDWVADYLHGKKKRPPNKPGRGSSIVWEVCIASTVDQLVSAGMTATRNDASDRSSACDAVAQALIELGKPPRSFSRVKKIWLDVRQMKDDFGVVRFKV